MFFIIALGLFANSGSYHGIYLPLRSELLTWQDAMKLYPWRWLVTLLLICLLVIFVSMSVNRALKGTTILDTKTIFRWIKVIWDYCAPISNMKQWQMSAGFQRDKNRLLVTHGQCPETVQLYSDSTLYLTRECTAGIILPPVSVVNWRQALTLTL